MKISIIIPVYNVEKYIVECLESVAAQTYQGDIECIIVDDCGNDKSIDIANKYINSYEGSIKFKIYHRKENGGLSAARNSGLHIATGDYIYFLDSDDKITENCIESLAYIAIKVPEADIVQGGILNTDHTILFNPDSCDISRIEWNKEIIKINLLMPDRIPVSSWNKLIKREILYANGILFKEGVIHEDVDFIYKLATTAKCIALCNEYTYMYRTQREGSILNTTNSEKSTKSRIVIYNSIIDRMGIKKDKVITRSLFLRIQYILLSPPTSNELNIQLRNLCQRLVKKVILCDKVLMTLYFYMPNYLYKSRYIYSFFYKYFTKYN